MEYRAKFKDLKIGDSFDFISPNIGYNSFFERCEKLSTRTYKSLSTHVKYRIGSIYAEVFHVNQ